MNLNPHDEDRETPFFGDISEVKQVRSVKVYKSIMLILKYYHKRCPSNEKYYQCDFVLVPILTVM